MSKKLYAFLCVIITAISSVLVGCVDFFNLPLPISETSTILEGAIISILGVWISKE